MLEATRRSRPLKGNAVRLMPAGFHPAGQDARSDGHSVNPTTSLQEQTANGASTVALALCGFIADDGALARSLLVEGGSVQPQRQSQVNAIRFSYRAG
jgi:hypothetical protein